MRTLLERVALLVGQREEAQRRLRGTVVSGKRKTGEVPGFEGQSRSVSDGPSGSIHKRRIKKEGKTIGFSKRNHW